jgi:ribonuclease-3
MATALEDHLGYVFRNRLLFKQALTHASLGFENGVTHNERLEFLGDAVLSFYVARMLFDRFPQASEGWLTQMKSKLVSGDSLVEKARQWNLGDYVLLGKGEKKVGGARKDRILGNTLEAVVAAMFLDGGNEALETLVMRVFLLDAERIAADPVTHVIRDYKSLLQERMQAMGLNPPRYEFVGAEGPEHQKTFTFRTVIEGLQGPLGSGNTKKKAQMACAQAVYVDDSFWRDLEARRKNGHD